MGPDISKQPQWRRTPDVDLQLIEEWRAGLTEHGDIAISLTSDQGSDPGYESDEKPRSQLVCTREDAKLMAPMIMTDRRQ